MSIVASLGGIAGVVSALAALAGAVTIVFKFFADYSARRAGRTEAALKAAVKESERARERAQIDADVRRLGDDAVLGELRRDYTRD